MTVIEPKHIVHKSSPSFDKKSFQCLKICHNPAAQKLMKVKRSHLPCISGENWNYQDSYMLHNIGLNTSKSKCIPLLLVLIRQNMTIKNQDCS